MLDDTGDVKIGKDVSNKCFLLLLSVSIFLLLWPSTTAKGDDPRFRGNDVIPVKAGVAELQKQITELQNRILQLETRQKPQKESVGGETEDPNESKPDTARKNFDVFWKDGLNFTTQDGAIKLKAGGRIQNDWLWISEDNDIKADVGEQEDGTEFRRARLYLSGLIYGNVEFMAQYDYAYEDEQLKDVYVGFLDFPFGKIRVGHFKEPFSLEELTSSKYITFLERALPNALSPGRNTGVMLSGTALEASDPRMTWAVGVFRDTPDDNGIRDDGGYNFTGRLTWLPYYENGGASLVHLGAAYSHRNPNDDTASFDSRPEAHLADEFVDTGSFQSDDVDLIGFEAARISGPFSIQGEYVFADADMASSANFHGYYAQAGYFLTGEHRQYKPSQGVFSKVIPRENFHYGGAPGAWEVALRYSGLDLDDGPVTGGKLHDLSTGLNWYLNLFTRIMWNYIHAKKDHVGNTDIFMMRLQVNF